MSGHLRWGLILGGVLLALVATVLLALPGYDIVLGVKDPIGILLRGSIPLKAELENQQVTVEMQEEVNASVSLGRFGIPLDETLEIPLNLRLTVPIETDVRIDEPLSLSLLVPIDTVLTEKELDLSQLEIPVDTEVYVDDVITLDVLVPIDSEVKTSLGMRVPVKADLPVKMQVPIRQKVRVKDRLKLKLGAFRVPLRATIPVQTQVQIQKTLRVKGLVDVPVRENIQVPLRQTIHPDIPPSIPLSITLKSAMPARLKASLDATIAIDQVLPAEIGEVRVNAGDVRIESRSR